MTPLAPTITRELAHILRRRAPLPPLDVLSEDEALRIVREAEWRRAEERCNHAFMEATRP